MPRLSPEQKALRAKRKEQKLSRVMGSTIKAHEKKTLPALAELYESVIREWGGKDAFVASIKEFYDKCNPGSQQQARILESIMDGMKLLHDRELLEMDEDVTGMSDEDLESYIEKIVHRVIEDGEDEDE